MCLFLFPVETARLGVLALAFGDPFAGFFGSFRSKFNLRLYGKSLFGFLACGLSAASVCLAHDSFFALKASKAATFAKYGLVAGLAESFSLLDDNLTMPSLFAFLLQLVPPSH